MEKKNKKGRVSEGNRIQNYFVNVNIFIILFLVLQKSPEIFSCRYGKHVFVRDCDSRLSFSTISKWIEA